MSNVPAGWYPNPDDANQIRYWDGEQWTFNTAPAVAQEPSTATRVSAVPAFLPPPAPGAAGSPATGAAPALATAPAGSAKKKWIIGGAIAAGVIVVGSVGAALGSGNRTEVVPEASAPPAVSTPSAAPVAEEPTPTTPPPAPVVEEVVDAVAFRAQAGSHLDDMVKDLDDIVTTVNEAGFWRLLSNSGELAFNAGQLQALDIPVNVATSWPESLVALDATLNTLSDAVSTQDGATILAAVDVVRIQVEVTRGVANTAQ